MRSASTFTGYALTIHLQPATASLEAEARVSLRNDGTEALRTLPLQLSSSLRFTDIHREGKPLRFAIHTVESDADHTGALTEAAVELPAPLPPGASLALTIAYAGTVEAASGRLERAQASAAFARSSDWDQIGEGFIALRGFGNTIWYPVSSVPALLGENGALARETERQRARNNSATVSMAITLEFTGADPNTLVLDGVHIAAPAPASLPTATFPGVLKFMLAPTKLGPQTPSLLAATREMASGSPMVAVAALPGHVEATQAYTSAASLLEPLFRDWFGGPPASPLLLIDVPVDDALPFDANGVLLLSLANKAQPSQLAAGLLTPLAHAYFHSPRPWLREGVTGLMELLWTERTEGRSKALEQLGAGRGPLALAEPATPGVAAGEPLATAQDSTLLRTKAAYVFAMLRALVGDDALRAAFKAYDPAKDIAPEYFEKLLTPTGTDAPAGEQPVDLHLFFQNWVYEDPGLPDLAISNVFSIHSGSGGQWLVAVEVANTGYAEAYVPLTVHSTETAETVLLHVPARGSVSRRVLLPDQPTEIDLNDGTVPEVQASAHQRLIN